MEVDSIVEFMEKSKNIKFMEGRNDRIKPLILHYNEVKAYPKPLILYVVIYILETMGAVVLRLWGFDRFSSGDEKYRNFSLSYWALIPEQSHSHAASTLNDKLPIV
jgi:hypothetical protein